MKNKITNTTIGAPPGIAAMLMPPGSIEASEARGAAEMVESDVLPVNLMGAKADFEALGFKFGAVIEGDEIFQSCTLPAGWKRERGDHSMWTYIVDSEGRRRVAVFYKAAFYDRNAHASLEWRYGVDVVDDSKPYEEWTHKLTDRKTGATLCTGTREECRKQIPSGSVVEQWAAP